MSNNNVTDNHGNIQLVLKSMLDDTTKLVLIHIIEKHLATDQNGNSWTFSNDGIHTAFKYKTRRTIELKVARLVRHKVLVKCGSKRFNTDQDRPTTLYWYKPEALKPFLEVNDTEKLEVNETDSTVVKPLSCKPEPIPMTSRKREVNETKNIEVNEKANEKANESSFAIEEESTRRNYKKKEESTSTPSTSTAEATFYKSASLQATAKTPLDYSQYSTEELIAMGVDLSEAFSSYFNGSTSTEAVSLNNNSNIQTNTHSTGFRTTPMTSSMNIPLENANNNNNTGMCECASTIQCANGISNMSSSKTDTGGVGGESASWREFKDHFLKAMGESTSRQAAEYYAHELGETNYDKRDT